MRRENDENSRMTGFYPTLDSIFFLSRAWNSPLFIGGGRGTFFLYWCQILALDSIQNDPNRWFKVIIMNCQK